MVAIWPFLVTMWYILNVSVLWLFLTILDTEQNLLFVIFLTKIIIWQFKFFGTWQPWVCLCKCVRVCNLKYVCLRVYESESVRAWRGDGHFCIENGFRLHLFTSEASWIFYEKLLRWKTSSWVFKISNKIVKVTKSEKNYLVDDVIDSVIFWSLQIGLEWY